jgi:hypothetical protein
MLRHRQHNLIWHMTLHTKLQVLPSRQACYSEHDVKRTFFGNGA